METNERKEPKFLTDKEIADYCLLLQEKKTFEERRDVILSIFDNPEIAVDKRLRKILNKEDLVKIREQTYADIDRLMSENTYGTDIKKIKDTMNTIDKDSI